MIPKNAQLFKEILKSYYEGVLDEKVEELIKDEEVDKEILARRISAICGVEVEYGENFSSQLKEALKNYIQSNKVIVNTHGCVADCVTVNGKTICENACPFNAIIINKETSQAEINERDCVNCGICVDICKRENFIDKIEFIPLQEIIKENKKVIAAVAPAISGQFGPDVSIGQIRSALKAIGFADMVEVAFFADMLTIKEASEFNKFVSEKEDFMLSSCCCPIWIGMIKKKFNELIKYTSPSVSPMIAAGRVIKAIDPECKVVFIGPCIAKKAEAKMEDIKGAIDYVLTFTELKDIFDVLDINLEKFPEELSTQYSSKGGRIYARVGGVSEAVREALSEMFPDKISLFTSDKASGVPECRKMLSDITEGKISARFLEGMGCIGGCVGGPKAIVSKEEGKKAVDKYGDDSKIKISVYNEIMNQFLNELGIKSLNDFENKEKISIFEREL